MCGYVMLYLTVPILFPIIRVCALGKFIFFLHNAHAKYCLRDDRTHLYLQQKHNFT